MSGADAGPGPATQPVDGPLDCPACGESAAPGSRFCEGCGTPLRTAAQVPLVIDPDPPAAESGSGPGSGTTAPTAPASDPATAARPCVRCGGAVADDGYCTECGEPAASERDHWSEIPATWVAGVCDRGIRHSRNEDAMALHASADAGATGFAALVVCDGVSAAPDSDVASLAAATAARDALARGGPGGAEPVTGTLSARMGSWSALVASSSQVANDAILATVGEMADRDNPPSCTFVAAVVDGPLVVVGWVGDSRVYWVPDDGDARQLSVDDSWAQEMIAQGIPRADAENAPQAHAITRWLGPDAPDPAARTAATVPEGPGWVLVCSDGLWNYCSPADDMATLVRATQEAVGTQPGANGPDPADLAGALVRWANAQGGRDNITVALARFAPAAGTPDENASASTR
ncbi:protein phosphatase 2C domain-containing protein [Cellulosimicrobium arenosum]|uniref:Protein phosphatase 2C domain-containing protein n=1 Tax=Cellulosimicrobium arenosum TaxID=2708133 RepID=A0A927J2B8_9MICO|nr:protein phosphatase 2C domain-containing protein [Cellulosimicrobium arenosum]MBD8080621.1 protein phosphatase 2C domain-containing protein [Cellulosimicrobium arenosum]